MQKIPIGLTIPDDFDSKQIGEFIANADSHCNVYLFKAQQPSLRAPHPDLYVVLSAIGSVASIAAIIWMAYEKFIAPRKTTSSDKSGIYITLKMDRKVSQFWIGGTHQNKEEFIRQFELTANTAGANERFRIKFEQTVAEIEISNEWVGIGEQDRNKG